MVTPPPSIPEVRQETETPMVRFPPGSGVLVVKLLQEKVARLPRNDLSVPEKDSSDLPRPRWTVTEGVELLLNGIPFGSSTSIVRLFRPFTRTDGVARALLPRSA